MIGSEAAQAQVPRGAAGIGRLPSVLREPLFHFVLIGIGLFVLFGLLGDAPPAPPPAREILVTPDRIERLSGQFEAVWRRPPTAEERAGLVDDYVREEVLYREALALGLDRDDAVIRRRLRQKMDFLIGSGADLVQPTDTALRDHLAANIAEFTAPPRVGFTQVFLGEPGDAEIAEALDALRRGVDPGTLGRPTLLPGVVAPGTESAVDGNFGAGFFASLLALDPGVWAGPVSSAYGEHLVRVETAGVPTAPDFAEVRGAVEADWRRTEAETMSEAQYQRLRERYDVVVPEAGAGQPPQ